MREDETIQQCAEDLSALGCVKSAERLSMIASVLANAISHGKDTDQINTMGNFIASVGALTLLIAAHIQECKSDND